MSWRKSETPTNQTEKAKRPDAKASLCPYLDRYCSSNCEAWREDEDGQGYCERLEADVQRSERDAKILAIVDATPGFLLNLSQSPIGQSIMAWGQNVMTGGKTPDADPKSA